MNLLSVDKLEKNFGERILFENINFGIDKGDKIALIANNGTGKSSLLKILARQDIADVGKVVYRNNCKVSYLPQESIFDDNITINDLINSKYNKISLIVKEYEKALEEHSKLSSAVNLKELERSTAIMDQENAWDYERTSKQILSKFNISNFSQKVGELSGGQKKRLSIALLLLENTDILLLDEPTNHLDISMIEWLEKYLQQQNITLLMVTHDRYFLEKVFNHIFELEGGNLYHHKGNYSYFLQKRDERESNFDVEISKAKKLMKKELDWIRRSPKARTTKSKARIDNFYNIKKKANSKKVKQELNIDVRMGRIGGKILELINIYKSFMHN